MNNYEQRIANKKERFEALADKASNESNATLYRARSMASNIPFGQPILIGHHSEGRDRNFRAKIHNTYGKGFALAEKSEYYANKAKGVGTGGISSDDPEAISKLKFKLEELQISQDSMKSANKINKGSFKSYQLTNNNANMSAVKKRIEILEVASKRETKEIIRANYTLRQDVGENRLLFIFAGKPDESTREVLKRNGFKWSPSRGAWSRQLTNNAIYSSSEIRRFLDNQVLEDNEVQSC